MIWEVEVLENSLNTIGDQIFITDINDVHLITTTNHSSVDINIH